MDRLRAMSVFVAAVDGGSLSAAGRKLRMPLPTVSRHVSELEAHLGARLLTRSTRRLTLTDAGRNYLEACRRILENLEEAERAAAGEYSAPKGVLVITAPVVFGRLHLLPVITEFLEAHREVDVRLRLGDRIFDLVEEHVDLAARIGELPDSRLIASRIGFIRRVTCASSAYLERRGAPRHPRELAAHDCVTFAGLVSSDAWTFAADRKEIEVPVRSRLVVTTAEAAIDAAVAGAGVTQVLSYQVAEAVATGKLTAVLSKFEPAPVPAHLVHVSQRPLPVKLRAFLDFATPKLRQRLGAETASPPSH